MQEDAQAQMALDATRTLPDAPAAGERSPFDLIFPDQYGGRLLRMVRAVALRVLRVQPVLDAVQRVRTQRPNQRMLPAVLDEFGIAWRVAGGDAAMIPRSGPLLVVSNHPFGAADGMIVHELVHAVRPDVRTFAAQQLAFAPEIRSEFIFVDVIARPGAARGNVRPMVRTLRWLAGGNAIAIYPAGAISQYSPDERAVVDPPWLPMLGALVRASGACVLPVLVHGANSRLFLKVGAFSPRLSTVLLAREFLRRRGTTVHVSIGEPVPAQELQALGSDEAITAELRRRTYALAVNDPAAAERAT